MTGFVLRAVLAALGLWLATVWVHGVRIDNAATLLLAGVLLGVINAIVRPIIVLLTLPLTVLTLGFFLLVVNALMLGLTALLLPGFHVVSFGAAFLAAIIVGVTGWLGSWLIGPRGRVELIVRRGR
ncbi:MAG: phage holin family protein [Steroidobacteraceae bacterium]